MTASQAAARIRAALEDMSKHSAVSVRTADLHALLAERDELVKTLEAASALLKHTPPICRDIYTMDDRGVSFGKRAKALRIVIQAALTKDTQ